MKILYLAHRIPFPPNKGDKIRTFNEIKHLSLSHDIDLACLADNPEDMKYKKSLEKYCKRVKVVPLHTIGTKINPLFSLLGMKKSLSVGYFYSRSLQKILDTWLSETTYDAVFCFCSVMAEYLFRSETLDFSLRSYLKSPERYPKDGRPLFVMDYCDLDSEKWRQYSEKSRFPMSVIYGIENKRLFDYEKLVNRFFDYSIFVSQREGDLFRELYPSARNLSAIPNGVDHYYFSPSNTFDHVGLKADPDEQVLVFTGAMDYYANIEGVEWFCRDIFPMIKNELPKAKFFIVGSNPSSRVKDLEQVEGVTVTGFVHDIRPYYHEADVCVVPLRIAAGIQNKVLEAMAMGKPVVTTSIALEGIHAQPEITVLEENSAHGFFKAVTDVLGDTDKGHKIGEKARAFIINEFGWDIGMMKLEKLLHSKP
jgi:sugar transferase (PEP-CTERM/EpsH1 system associated)